MTAIHQGHEDGRITRHHFSETKRLYRGSTTFLLSVLDERKCVSGERRLPQGRRLAIDGGVWSCLPFRRRSVVLISCLPIRPRIVILQYAQSGADHVIELTAVGHGKEHPDCDKHNHDAERDKQIKRFHEIS
jgi:hypothetical protein